MTEPELGAGRLSEILRLLPEVVLFIDRDRRIRYINRTQEGHALQDVIGSKALDFVVPEVRERQAELLDRVFDTGEPAEYEIPVFDGDGEREWYEGILIPVVDDGCVTGVVVVTRNATERHRAEEEAEKLRHLIPVCSWCKKVRDDEGYWQELEAYIEEAGQSRVTHGMCPRCEREKFGRGDRGTA